MRLNNIMPKGAGLLPTFGQTITVYNQYVDSVSKVTKWFRTVLENCFYKNDNKSVTVGTTAIKSDNVIVRVPESEKFLPRYEWEKIPTDLMPEYFTLSTGDMVINGYADDEIKDAAGQRASDVLAKYKKLGGAITIKQVNINTGGGRLLPHYYVSGV